MDTSLVILIIAIFAGLYMAWNIGANDVANAMGTSVGSHAISIRQAIVIAAIFEFLGAFLAGEQVTNTIKQGIIDPMIFANNPREFATGMTASLLATAFWLQIASARGLPVSTTHSIVGAVLGCGVLHAGVDAVKWEVMFNIVASWFISPVTGGLLSFGTFFIIRKYILDSRKPIEAMKWIAPPMLFIAVVAVLFAFFDKSLEKLGLVRGESSALLVTLLVAIVITGIAQFFMRRVQTKSENRDEVLAEVERVFAILQVVTACFMALAHGSNDVANAVGPVAAVVTVVRDNVVISQSAVPFWLLGLGGIGIVVGLSTYGKKVIETVGKGITEITPTRGFAAEFGAATTIMVGTYFGLPLSTTQVLVGCVIGVGLARGIAGLNTSVIRKITGSWLITIPMTASVSALFCYIIKLVS